MKKGNHTRYFFIAVFVCLIILALFLIRPLLIAILGAIILSYIFYPVYRFFNKGVKHRAICSVLVTILILAIIVVPVVFLTNAFIGEAAGFYDRVSESGVLPTLERFSDYVNERMGVSIEVRDIIDPVGRYLAGSLTGFIKGLTDRLLGLFVMVLLIYYFLKDGEKMGKSFQQLIPMSGERKNKLVKRFKEVINATVFGTIVTGIVQGSIGGIGLWIFGVEAPILGAIAMIILSILPVVGPPVIWFPAALWLMFVRGDWFNGIGLMLYGFFIVGTIDNIIRPKLMSTKVKLHPSLILVGVLGGLFMFGVVGLVLGPLILGLLDVFIGFYRSEHVTKGQRR